MASSSPPTLGAKLVTILEYIGAAVIFVMMLHVLANVVSRFFFNAPIRDTLEIVQYWYMPIVAFLGFVVAKKLGEHIEAPLIFDSLTWGNRRLLVIINAIISIAISLLFAYYTFVNGALHGFAIKETGGASTVPIWPVLFLVPVVYTVLSLQWAIDVLRATRGQIEQVRGDDSVLTPSPHDTRDETPATEAGAGR